MGDTADRDMLVPGRIFASEKLIAAMDEKVGEQVRNVACLPGIQVASMAMPDAHWGYGFPSAVWPPSIPTRAASSPWAAWVSTSPAASGP